ncbi:hypothetical protein SADUNF_Sadunf14G0089300 [Salix dunnii]|uniref:Uncharacterized protein n=1 Tax=Salix dunnii TaxID=1413687 RepID=A0A835MKN4_9ROSI|nr:hypothetical protein SADUNF_Sadunf14G0089300 [Salix dunnii]
MGPCVSLINVILAPVADINNLTNKRPQCQRKHESFSAQFIEGQRSLSLSIYPGLNSFSLLLTLSFYLDY